MSGAEGSQVALKQAELSLQASRFVKVKENLHDTIYFYIVLLG